MKHMTVTWAVFAMLILTYLDPCFAHREITNTSGKPVRVMDLNNTEGKPFARLYMTGEKMSIDHYQYPESGAGYYEALEGHTYYIPFTKGGLGGLHVNKVKWDDNGNLIAVEGLRPYFDGSEKIPIVSDVTNPRIENSTLFLKFKGKGSNAYSFTIKYGIGLSIEPSLSE